MMYAPDTKLLKIGIGLFTLEGLHSFTPAKELAHMETKFKQMEQNLT